MRARSLLVVSGLASLLAGASVVPRAAEARLTRIAAAPGTVIDLPAFGKTGTYLKNLWLAVP
jgi:hypothetical protein